MLRLFTVILFLVTATSAHAFTISCQQTSISSKGFKTAAAAKKFFVDEFLIQTQGDKAGSRPYGLGTVSKVGDRYVFSFNIKPTQGSGVFAFRINFYPKTGRYTQTMSAGAGFVQAGGARGRCVRTG